MRKFPADSCTVRPGARLREAIERLRDAGLGIVLVQEETGPLRGIVTNADVREAFLRGAGLDDPVSSVMNTAPVSVRAGESVEAIARAIARASVLQVPLLDADGRATGIVLSDPTVSISRTNWALVLAGGEGKRLGPLTANRPKPMLPLRGRPILEDILLHLRGEGFRRVFLATRYLAEQIRDHFGDGASLGIEIAYLSEDKPLGTAGPIRLLPERPKETFLVMNGDLLARFDADNLFAFHRARGAVATIASIDRRLRIPYGILRADGDKIREIHEKPEQQIRASAGIYLFEPEIFDLLPPGDRIDMPDFLNLLARSGRPVHACPLEGYWLDIGQGHDYARAQEDVSLIDLT